MLFLYVDVEPAFRAACVILALAFIVPFVLAIIAFHFEPRMFCFVFLPVLLG